MALIALTGCLPRFEESQNGQLRLELTGETLRLYSDRLMIRGAIAIRAEKVVSSLCRPAGCVPDAQGRVLIVLDPPRLWGDSVVLGKVTGLVRARAEVVRKDEAKAVGVTLEP